MPSNQTFMITRLKPKVLAAIHCYNDGYFIGNVVSRVRELVPGVIVVDNGSADSTADVTGQAVATYCTVCQTRCQARRRPRPRRGNVVDCAGVFGSVVGLCVSSPPSAAAFRSCAHCVGRLAPHVDLFQDSLV